MSPVKPPCQFFMTTLGIPAVTLGVFPLFLSLACSPMLTTWSWNFTGIIGLIFEAFEHWSYIRNFRVMIIKLTLDSSTHMVVIAIGCVTLNMHIYMIYIICIYTYIHIYIYNVYIHKYMVISPISFRVIFPRFSHHFPISSLGSVNHR